MDNADPAAEKDRSAVGRLLTTPSHPWKNELCRLMRSTGVLQKPADWGKIKLAKLDFYEPLLQTVRQLVKAEKQNSLILMTLYSPFMCAGHCATAPVLLQHLEENPEAVKKGLEILTESQLLFVRACIKEGVDGFYTSTQGSEAKRFSDPALFSRYVKPLDLVSMKEIATACPFNILHVCDYVAPYANHDAVTD
jgi:uroporphyrinogen decarboxylase